MPSVVFFAIERIRRAMPATTGVAPPLMLLLQLVLYVTRFRIKRREGNNNSGGVPQRRRRLYCCCLR